MAKATVAARKEVEALKAKFNATRTERRKSLERRLFGPIGTPNPTDLTIVRDSVDRARKLENEEAAHAALRAAEQSGVTYMSRAIVAVTVAKHWTAMVDSFAESTGTTTRGVLDP